MNARMKWNLLNFAKNRRYDEKSSETIRERLMITEAFGTYSAMDEMEDGTFNSMVGSSMVWMKMSW